MKTPAKTETSTHKYRGTEYAITKENRKKPSGKIRSNLFFYTGEVVLRENFAAGKTYTHINNEGGKFVFIKEEIKYDIKDFIFKNENGIETKLNPADMVVAVKIHVGKKKHLIKQRCKRDIIKFYGHN